MKEMIPKADRYLLRSRRHRMWRRVVGALACVVVFCTTYALILPAITLENTTPASDTVDTHTHTTGCYDQDGVLICNTSLEQEDYKSGGGSRPLSAKKSSCSLSRSLP